MTTALQFTAKDTGATASTDILAPTLDIGLGVPAAMSSTFSNAFSNPTATVFGGDTVSNVTAYNGFRRAKVMDLSDRPWVQFQLAANNITRQSHLKYAAGGGVIVAFVDNVGNFAAFKVHGSDNNWGPFGQGANGYFSTFNAPQTEFAYIVNVERGRTPDFGSATAIDWANIAAYEVHFRPSTTGRSQGLIAMLRTVDVPVSTGAVSTLLSAVAAAWTTLTPSVNMFFVKAIPPWAGGTAGTLYGSQIGMQVGDGTTATTGTISGGSVAFWNPPEDTHDTASPLYTGSGASVQPVTPRLIDFFQSATDSVTVQDGSIASSRLWGWRVRGNTAGTLAAKRLSFTRPAQFECAHGSYTDCIWDGHTAAIQVTANTVITRGTIRNGVGHGLRITGAAGNYAGLQVAFDNNSTYDLEVGSGGAGTYVLTGASVLNGAYTFKIRNESATNAVTVQIPGGITYSTSTAGGTITVATPSLFQSVTVNGLITGSLVQIYDTTNSVELFNATATGTSVTWTDSVAATGNRAIRVRVAKVSGTTAKAFLEANIGTCGTSSTTAALSYLANQVDDPVYNANAIDGSTVTGITISDSIDRVLISAAGGSKTYPQIYAYQCWWLSTTAGIIDDGAFITAVDTANYLFAGFQIRNTSATALTITGGYGRDSTTGTSAALIDTAGSSGNIFLAPDHVVPFSTGSGLTSGQAADLTAIASATANLSFSGGAVNANVAKFAGATITGAGVSTDPFKPA